MEDEIRKAGDYTIIQSMHIGKIEVILGEDLNNKNGEFYLVANYDNFLNIDRFSSCVVSENFMEVAEVFADRLKNEITDLKKENENVNINIIRNEHCTPSDEILNKIIAIKNLRPEYRNDIHQIYRVTDGNGAVKNALGSSVFCTNIYSGEKYRCSKTDVIGVLKKECYPKWLTEKLQIKKKKDIER